jgi:hypothetical protein
MYSDDGKAYRIQLERELDESDYAVLGAKRHLLHAFHLEITPKDGEAAQAWDRAPGTEEPWGDAGRRLTEAESAAWFRELREARAVG